MIFPINSLFFVFVQTQLLLKAGHSFFVEEISPNAENKKKEVVGNTDLTPILSNFPDCLVQYYEFSPNLIETTSTQIKNPVQLTTPYKPQFRDNENGVNDRPKMIWTSCAVIVAVVTGDYVFDYDISRSIEFMAVTNAITFITTHSDNINFMSIVRDLGLHNGPSFLIKLQKINHVANFLETLHSSVYVLEKHISMLTMCKKSRHPMDIF
ncbi:unnamed protein product [Allacma fusca]|uniref:Uncharacterized protein n=1 Tax=Allacma fusca TaxID=39272 RepID=A0A8J2LFT6_9HEXA|nr:unnamed protein product [Allacma fusca]